jgi:hypothetical protein
MRLVILRAQGLWRVLLGQGKGCCELAVNVFEDDGRDFGPLILVFILGLSVHRSPSAISVASEAISRSPINLRDVDYFPLRRLVFQLDPGVVKPLALLLSYVECLDDDHKPRILGVNKID